MSSVLRQNTYGGIFLRNLTTWRQEPQDNTKLHYHESCLICHALIGSLVQRVRIAIWTEARLTWVVGLRLITRYNVRKWGRMTGRMVKMEKWVGTDGQGLYRVELHYNRIDRRRRHTLSHNLGLQSPPKCISHSWTRKSFCPDDVCSLNQNTHVKLPGTQNNGRRATLAPVDDRRHKSIVLNDAGTHAPCYMTSVPYVFDSLFKFHLQCPIQEMNYWIS